MNKTRIFLGLSAALSTAVAFVPRSAVANELPGGGCGGSSSWCEDNTSCDVWVNGECVHKVKTTSYIDLPQN